ncbi:hypothetical protein SDC9_181789 [bioreactor metagenome]|uniref:Uncharacterized protein n=1 Tax=bioreactor metagenome TaxID=1076179 RepID=A0A645H730_9ZZZZ
MTIIHTGKFEGKLNASKTPVIAAEPSRMELPERFIIKRAIAHSKNKQAATEVSVTINAPKPK